MTDYDLSAYLNADDTPEDPLEVFELWLNEAEKREISNFNAMTVATVDPDGRPSSRTVLLKGFDKDGFVFYTNTASRKGRALAVTPYASLCFYWKSLDRQITVEGAVKAVSDEEADAYYASRPRGSRIGAWASQQSQALENRQALEDAVKNYEEKFDGQNDIPRPPHWSGYRIVPENIIFWQQGEHRLHYRLCYTRREDGWEREFLYP